MNKRKKIRKKSRKGLLKADDIKTEGFEGFQELFSIPLINVQKLTRTLAPNDESHKDF